MSLTVCENCVADDASYELRVLVTFVLGASRKILVNCYGISWLTCDVSG